MESSSHGRATTPQIFRRTEIVDIDRHTPMTSYLSLRLESGQLESLIVKIWAIDREKLENLKSEDPFENSKAYFSLGLVQDASSPGQTDAPDLIEFQRTICDSFWPRCYINEWHLGIPMNETDENDEAHAWLESVVLAKGLTIGIFPSVEYAASIVRILKMEASASYKDLSPKDQGGFGMEQHGTTRECPRPHVRSIKDIDWQTDSLVMREALQQQEPNSIGGTDFFNPPATGADEFEFGATRLYDISRSKESVSFLDAVIIMAQACVEATPRSHLKLTSRLINLGTYYANRYIRAKDADDLENAIRFTRQSVESVPETDPNHAICLKRLIKLLSARFEDNNLICHLEEPIRVIEHALRSTPPDDPNWPTYALCMTNQLVNRYSTIGDRKDLERCIELSKRALEITQDLFNSDSAPHESYDGLVYQFGWSLYMRAEFTTGSTDLDDAIDITKKTMKLSKKDPGDLSWSTHLAKLLSWRFRLSGVDQDLDEAIALTRTDEIAEVPQSTEGTADEDTVRINVATIEAQRCKTLGVLLELEYSLRGKVSALDEAIQLQRRALKLMPIKKYLSELRANLAVSLFRRYRRTDVLEDLQEAITQQRSALQLENPEGPTLWRIYHDLATLVSSRGIRINSLADLDEGISLARRALELPGKGQNGRVTVCHHLGFLLSERATLKRLVNISNFLEDLEAAALETKWAIENTPPDHPLQGIFLTNLGHQENELYQVTKDTTYLDRSINSARKGIHHTPETDPSRSFELTALAKSLLEKSSLEDSFDTKEEYFDCLIKALKAETSPLKERIRAGGQLLSTSHVFESPMPAGEISKYTLDLLSLAVSYVASTADKYVISIECGEIARDAAAVVLQVEKAPTEAIQLLESGRGLFASGLSDLRADLSMLKKKCPHLAEEFEDVCQVLEVPTKTNFPQFLDSEEEFAPHLSIDKRYIANDKMRRLLNHIRDHPELSRFLLPPTVPEMCQAASKGIIVMINVSTHRCDAFIAEERGLQSCRLPDISLKMIEHRSSDPSSVETMHWLWDSIVEPVLSKIKTNSGGTLPHIWWIPTGPLTKFPLHAAGYHLEQDGRTAIDKVISSYAPSIKSLIMARGHAESQEPKAEGDVVLISMQNTPKIGALVHASEEVETVEGLCQSLNLPTVRPKASRQDTISALSRCRIFHFAGHGGTTGDPLKSRLFLNDWEDNPLTVTNLMETNLRATSPFLAYLSACETGQNKDSRSADESLHIASAFQLAGFRHVIGTLWKVNDRLCVEMAEAVYEELLGVGLYDTAVSSSLHHASKKLRDHWVEQRLEAASETARAIKNIRDVVPVDDLNLIPPLWVPYVHFGV
ncbi:Uncharacterized protein LW93_13537 [Fusarium fujikuroi]|nr:Uncharacterized protein LW93_13537 [Fusarium fujikuroi]